MKFSAALLSAIACILSFSPTAANADSIPVIELRYQIITEGSDSSFLSLAQAKCPYVKIINDSSSSNKIVVGSADFVSKHGAAIRSPSVESKVYMLSISENGRGLISSSSLEKSAEGFADTACRDNRALDKVVNNRLPIAVKSDMAQFADCGPGKGGPHCVNMVSYSYLVSELNAMISSPHGGLPIDSDTNHQMPYELLVKFADTSGGKLVVQLTLARYLNGAIVGNQSMNLTFAYDIENSSSLGDALLAKRVAIMSWLSERVQDQEWDEEVILDKAGANR